MEALSNTKNTVYQHTRINTHWNINTRINSLYFIKYAEFYHYNYSAYKPLVDKVIAQIETNASISCSMICMCNQTAHSNGIMLMRMLNIDHSVILLFSYKLLQLS